MGFTSYTPEVTFKLNQSKKYVYLKSIVVKRDFHGIGLGSQLLNKFIETSLSIKQGVFSTVWINKSSTSAFEQMLKKACFVKHSEHLNIPVNEIPAETINGLKKYDWQPTCPAPNASRPLYPYGCQDTNL